MILTYRLALAREDARVYRMRDRSLVRFLGELLLGPPRSPPIETGGHLRLSSDGEIPLTSAYLAHRKAARLDIEVAAAPRLTSVDDFARAVEQSGDIGESAFTLASQVLAPIAPAPTAAVHASNSLSSDRDLQSTASVIPAVGATSASRNAPAQSAGAPRKRPRRQSRPSLDSATPPPPFTPVTPSPTPSLSLVDVDAFLTRLSTLSKDDEQRDALRSVLPATTPLELKWLVRLIKHDLRVGAQAAVFLTALDWAAAVEGGLPTSGSRLAAASQRSEMCSWEVFRRGAPLDSIIHAALARHRAAASEGTTGSDGGCSRGGTADTGGDGVLSAGPGGWDDSIYASGDFTSPAVLRSRLSSSDPAPLPSLLPIGDAASSLIAMQGGNGAGGCAAGSTTASASISASVPREIAGGALHNTPKTLNDIIPEVPATAAVPPGHTTTTPPDTRSLPLGSESRLSAQFGSRTIHPGAPVRPQLAEPAGSVRSAVERCG